MNTFELLDNLAPEPVTITRTPTLQRVILTPPWVDLSEEEKQKMKRAFCEINALRCTVANSSIIRFLFSLFGGHHLANIIGARWRTREGRGDAVDALWTRAGHTYRISVKTCGTRLFSGRRNQEVQFLNSRKTDGRKWAWPAAPMFDYMLVVGFDLSRGLDIVVIPEAAVRKSPTTVIGDSQVKYTIRQEDCCENFGMNALDLLQMWDDLYLHQWGTVPGNPREHRKKYLNLCWEEALLEMFSAVLKKAAAYRQTGLNLTP